MLFISLKCRLIAKPIICNIVAYLQGGTGNYAVYVVCVATWRSF